MRYASDDEVPDCVSEDDASESEDEWDSENEDLAPETMAAVTALEALAWCVLQTHVPPDAAQGLVKERRGRPKAADDDLVQARRNHVGATTMASRVSSDFEAAKLATHLQAAAPSRPKRASRPPQAFVAEPTKVRGSRSLPPRPPPRTPAEPRQRADNLRRAEQRRKAREVCLLFFSCLLSCLLSSLLAFLLVFFLLHLFLTQCLACFDELRSSLRSSKSSSKRTSAISHGSSAGLMQCVPSPRRCHEDTRRCKLMRLPPLLPVYMSEQFAPMWPTTSITRGSSPLAIGEGTKRCPPSSRTKPSST